MIDCVKWDDKGSDNHSSKTLTVPMNPGRRVAALRKTERGWEVRIAKEEGFDPARDIDVGSVIAGPQGMVAYGAGVPVTGTEQKDDGLTLIFPDVAYGTPVITLLGREKSGRLFFITFRTDGIVLEGPFR